MAQLILDYIKVILSPQVIAGAVGFTLLALFRDAFKALLLRIAKIRLPGGTEVSTSQITKAEEAAENKPLDRLPPAEPPPPLPPSLDHNELEQVKQLLDAERARAYLWEYRYLNYFLVYHTQQVLDWFASFPSPTSLSLFDSAWAATHPKRRRAPRHHKRFAGALLNRVAWRPCAGYGKRKRIYRMERPLASAEGVTDRRSQPAAAVIRARLRNPPA